ncbi:Nucleoid-associated protein [bacterium HR23]|nr:Nucleoid-associated protein [bacterium HR23]
MNRNMLKQLQQMQARLLKVQQELETATVEASAGGGAVKVVVTGKLRLQKVTIDPSAIDPQDPTMLEEMVQAAVNEGLQKAEEMASQRISQVTGGLKIPGL